MEIEKEIEIIKLALLGILKTIKFPEKEICEDEEKFKEYHKTKNENLNLTIKILKENLTKE